MVAKTFKNAVFGLFILTAIGFSGVGCGDDSDSSPDASCETEADCPSDKVCSDAGKCVSDGSDGCEADGDCSPGYCGDGQCRQAACESDDDCVGNNICDGERCRTGCRQDDDCPGDETCNSIGHFCESTSCTPSSCRDHRQCDESSGECVYDGSCDTAGSGVCAAYGRQLDNGKSYICNENKQECVEKPPCEVDDDCARGKICIKNEDARNTCEAGCRTDEGCGIDEYCSEDNKCVTGCSSDADCEDAGTGSRPFYCHNNLRCVPGCDSRDDCSEGQVCLGSPQVCQGCTEDGQCAVTEMCDKSKGSAAETGRCVDLPPECPDDGFGDNDSPTSPYEVTELPFEPSGQDRPLFCRQHQAGEWFAVSATSGKVIDVSLEYEAAGNIDLALWKNPDTELVASERRPSIDEGRERIQYGVQVDRTFLIQVRGGVTEQEDNVALDLDIDVRDPKPCEGDGLEPNDSVSNAVDVPEGQSFTDLEVCGDDADFYNVSLAANQILTATAEAPVALGNLDLFLYTSSGDLVAESETMADDETLEYETREGGDFVIEVRAANGAGRMSYDFSWTSEKNVCSDQYDPNEQCPAHATELSNGAYSNLNVCTDRDYYAIEMLPRQTLTATATFNPVEDNGELRLTLFGPNSCLNVLTSASEKSVEDSTDKQLIINHEAQTGGTYYLRADKFQGTRVPYSLDVQVGSGPECTDDDFEANDDSSAATSISRDDVVSGKSATLLDLKICDDDKDWYSVELQGGDELEWVTTFDHSEGNLDIDLIDTDGSTVLEESNSDTDDESVSYTVPDGAGGTYYLRVQGRHPTRTNYRVLTYVNGKGPADRVCPDKYEENDSCESTDDCEATEVSPGTHDNLLFCAAESVDNDWYKTKVKAGETINVETTFDRNKGDLNLRMFDDTLSVPVDQSSTQADNEKVSYQTSRDQFVYYRVSTVDPSLKSNTYSMDVGIDDAGPCSDDQFEPNEESSSATSLEAPGLYTDLKKCEDNADWYGVDLNKGQVAEVFVNHDSSLANLDVEVYAPSDLSNPVATGDSTSDDEDVLLEDPSETGTYYIKVFSTNRARLRYDLLLYRDLDDSGSIDGSEEGPVDRSCPDALENNDGRQTARTVSSGTYEDLSLCWGDPFDSDFYRIFVPEGATLNASLAFKNEDGNLDLKVYEVGSFNPEATSSTSTDDESVSVPNDGVGQNYIVEVAGSSGTFRNSYDLSLELEFNTTCFDDNTAAPDKQSATELSTGTYDLTLCEETEDWMELPISSGESVELNLEQQSRLGNIEMQIIDDSTVVAETNSDANIKNLEHTVSGNGPFYLRVYPEGGATIRNGYDLWASIAESTPTLPFCADDYERNDTRDVFTTLDLMGTSNQYSGQFVDMVACGQDTDWYQVELVANQTYAYNVFYDDQGGSIELGLEVRDAKGDLVDDENGDSIQFPAQKTSEDELTSFTPSSTGNYYLGVKNKGSSGRHGPYMFNLAKKSSSGNALECPEDPYEFNNNGASATDITPSPNSLPIHLALGACGDTDFYKWTAPTSGQVTVRLMMNNDFVNLGLIVEEIDSETGNTTQMGEDQGVATPTDDNRASVTFDAEAGKVYRLEVVRGTVGGAQQPANGPYFLKIE